MNLRKLFALVGLVLVTGSAAANNIEPNSMTFADGSRVTIANNQVVSVYQNNQMTSQSSFGDNGYDYWQSVDFVKALQKAVSEKNINAIAEMVQFPLRVNSIKHQEIKTKADFLKAYPTIFTQAVQDKITTLNPYIVFCNSQGVSFANGLMWLNQTSTKPQQLKIISINLP